MKAPPSLKDKDTTAITRLAFLWMTLVSEPFVALYGLLLFILPKDLGATPLQISVLATLRPVLSVFSFYWSANLLRKRSQLLPNFVTARLLSLLPFFLLPLLHDVWFVICCAGAYQLFSRACIPAQMEILKLNMEKRARERLFYRLYALGFIESLCLGLFVGKILDLYVGAWQLLLPIAAFLSLTSLYIQLRIPLPQDLKPDPTLLPVSSNRLLQPIKDALHLMRSRPDFARFQWGFMLGGFSLMFITPAMHIYFATSLKLTHDTLAMARCIWMGLGVLLTSSLWKRYMSRLAMPQLTAAILCGFTLFYTLLFLAKIHLFYLHLAFFFYGVSQAGSHPIWHLSGTLFATDEDSSKFSTVNVLMVGLRGLLAPALGGICCAFLPVSTIFAIGIMIGCAGVIYMLLPSWAPKARKSPTPSP